VTEYLDDTYDVADPEFVSVYDELPLWSAMFGQVLLEHLPLRPNLKVLDVGCGTGFPALELAGRLGPSCQVYAVDPWKPAMARVERKLDVLKIPNVKLFAGDAAAMPFAADEFDLIVSNLGINNFDRPEAFLGECRRVAKRSALLALTTNLRGHMEEFYGVFRTTLTELGKEAEQKALEAHVEHRVTVERASGMLEGAGFGVRRVHQQTFTMRFLDGTALLRHAFIKIGFLDAWQRVVDAEDRQRVFARLEENLNRLARKQGELALAIPMAYIEAEKVT
jgi:arsenite methyltransferase